MRSSSRCLPDVQMSRRYSSWRSLRSPNIPVEEHLGEADDRVERRPELVRHAREELGLVPTGDLQLGPLGVELAEEACVDDGQRRLVGERPQQLAASRRRSRRVERRRITRAPTSRSRRTSGTASSERQPSSSSTSRCSSRGDRAEVGDLERACAPTPSGRPATWRARSRRCAQPSGERLGAAGRGPHAGSSPRSASYSMIEPPSAPVSRTAPLDDLGEDLLEVQARADRVDDLAQHLELGRPWRRAPRCGRPSAATSSTWRRTIAAWDGERADEVDLALVEGAGLGAPHRQDRR